MSCLCSNDAGNLFASIANVESQYAFITGNLITNYTQITRKGIFEQANVYNNIYYGLGNMNVGNLSINGNVNINGNIQARFDGNVNGNLGVGGFDYKYYTLNGATTYTLSSNYRKFNFVQRKQLNPITSGTSYNCLKISYSRNCGIILIANIVGHLYYSATTSTGLIQLNRILIDSNNTTADTSVSSVSNGTATTISKGTSNTWSSCNMSTDLTTAGEALINVTPVYTGTQSLSASGLSIDWTILFTNNNADNINILTIQAYG